MNRNINKPAGDKEKGEAEGGGDRKGRGRYRERTDGYADAERRRH